MRTAPTSSRTAPGCSAAFRESGSIRSQFQTEYLPSLSWPSFIPTQLLVLPPEGMPPIALYRYVRDLEGRHQQAVRFEQELWAKISIPFSIAAIIMIAAPFVFGPPGTEQRAADRDRCAVRHRVHAVPADHALSGPAVLDLNPAVSALAPSLHVDEFGDLPVWPACTGRPAAHLCGGGQSFEERCIARALARARRTSRIALKPMISNQK